MTSRGLEGRSPIKRTELRGQAKAWLDLGHIFPSGGSQPKRPHVLGLQLHGIMENGEQTGGCQGLPGGWRWSTGFFFFF